MINFIDKYLDFIIKKSKEYLFHNILKTASILLIFSIIFLFYSMETPFYSPLHHSFIPNAIILFVTIKKLVIFK